MYKIDGKRLKELRNKKGITQKQLAEETYISLPSIKRYEKEGLNNIDTNYLLDLADYFEIYPEWLCGGNIKDERDVIKKNLVLSTTQEQRQAIMNRLSSLKDKSKLRDLISSIYIQDSIIFDAESLSDKEIELIVSYWDDIDKYIKDRTGILITDIQAERSTDNE